MRFLLVLAFATVALAGTVLPNQGRPGRPMSDKIDAFVLDVVENNDGELEVVVEPEDGSMESKLEGNLKKIWQNLNIYF